MTKQRKPRTQQDPEGMFNEEDPDFDDILGLNKGPPENKLINEEAEERKQDGARPEQQPMQSLNASKSEDYAALTGGLMPLKLLATVYKRSGWGLTHHERLLKVDRSSLSYYRAIPVDFNAKDMVSATLFEGKSKPKTSIPIEKITAVEELSEDDRKKMKKFAGNNQPAFKVTFDCSAVVKGEVIPEDSDEEPNMTDSNRGTEGGAPGEKKSVRINPKKLKTYFFSVKKALDQQGNEVPVPTSEQWVESISLFIMGKNNEYKPCPPVRTKIQQRKNDMIKESQKRDQERQALGMHDPNSNIPTTVSKKDNNIDKVVNNKENDKPLDDRRILNQRKKEEEKTLEKGIEQNLLINPPPGDIIQGQGRKNWQQTAHTRNKGQHDNDHDQMDLLPEKRLEYEQKIIKYMEKSLLMNQSKKEEEEKGWDLKYQNYWSNIVASQNDFKKNIKLSELLIAHMGEFRKAAAEVFEQIVDELHLPLAQRKIRPLEQIEENYAVFLDEESPSQVIFYDDKLTRNIIIKLTHQGDISRESLVNGEEKFDQTRFRAGESYHDGSSAGQMRDQLAANRQERSWWKQFGREQLSFDILFDALLFNSKPDGSFRLRVPLTAMIDYKGFRGLAIAHIQISPQINPDLGFQNGRYCVADDKIKQELGFVGDVLNVEENRTKKSGYSQQFESVPVSNYIRVYKYSQPEGKEKGQRDDSPTMRGWFDYHYTELDYVQEPKYVLGTSEIFPYDLELAELFPNRDKVLRPELVCTYERPLKVDTKKHMPAYVSPLGQASLAKGQTGSYGSANDRRGEQTLSKNEEEENDVVKLNEAARFLKKTQIPQLVDLLESLIIIPIDSQALEEAFHVQGVNMRYLGTVASACSIPHIKDICITEMFARTLKRMFNTQISQEILDHNQRHEFTLAQLNEKEQQIYALSSSQTKQIHLPVRSTLSKKQQVEKSLAELKKEVTRLCKDLEMLEQPNIMDQLIKEWIIDFMNLIFGSSEDRDNYWDEVVVYETSVYYQFPIADLKKHEIKNRLNALYFTLTELIGLKVTPVEQKEPEEKKNRNMYKAKTQNDNNEFLSKDKIPQEETFYKDFGKIESPFVASQYHIEFIPKTRTYRLRNLPYSMLAEQFREYQNRGQIKDAIRSCRMRSHIKRQLIGEDADISNQADLCEIYLEKRHWKLAFKFALRALQVTPPLHARSIKFYCILMQACYMDDQTDEADIFFTKALQILDHHWGPFHPLHISIYAIMAQLLIQRGKYEDAGYLYQASQLCCMRILGPNHIQTGEVHMDFGKLFLKKQEFNESLQHFIEAYLIYESYFGKNALQTAEAAMNIARLLETQKRHKHAYKYATVASATYQNVYTAENPQQIFAMWQMLSIAYALREADSLKQASMLLNALARRDFIVLNKEDDPSQKILVDQKKDEAGKDLITQQIESIKVSTIATVIMEITRSLKDKEKTYVKAFCDKLLFSKKLQEAKDGTEEIIPSLIEYHYKQIDPSRIQSVQNLRFSVKEKVKLMHWYNTYAIQIHQEGGFAKSDDTTMNTDLDKHDNPFVEHFLRMLNEVLELETKHDAKKRAILEGKEQPAFNQQQTQGADGQTKVTDGSEGANRIFDDINEESDSYDFFLKLIQIFDSINFYNLLAMSHEQEDENGEQV